MRFVELPAFAVAGQKTWITGQNTEEFGRFWATAQQSGLVDRLKALAARPGLVGGLLGVSRVENDPANRAFDFYIAAECEGGDGLERFTVPACLWAVFAGEGGLPTSLVNAERYAFAQWLPASGYRHAAAPEMEVYPMDGRAEVEFWLPVAAK